VEWLSGSKLIGHIPLANVARVDIYRMLIGHSISIMLIDTRDPDTFWPRGERGLHTGLKALLFKSECDIRLPAIWRESADNIVTKIAARLEHT
jgi:hypothetical protein